MKQCHKLYLFYFLLVFFSCGQPQKKEPELVLQPFNVRPTYTIIQKSDPLPIDVAAQMISNGLSDPFLEIVARRQSVAGYFRAVDLRITGNNRGIILWPCYNPGAENGNPVFFLAAEQVEKYDSINPVTNKPGDATILPREVLKYTWQDIDHVKTESEIRQKKSVTPNSYYLPIKGVKVAEYVKNFEKLMIDFSPNPRASICKYGQYFFLNNSTYSRFMNRTGLEYIYYYMGLAWDDDHKPNYYRPILMGVMADGSIMDVDAKASDQPLLQKSIPPPPEY